MPVIRVLFFGSTADSVIVLNSIFAYTATHPEVKLSAAVTQPPKPAGRKHIITKTPIEVWATDHRIPVLSFPTDPEKPWRYRDEQTVIDTLEPLRTDLIISACYGQKIPAPTITSAKYGGLNVHPSLLPRWRGADPVPWAIFTGDRQTGVTLVTLGEHFDAGRIIAQKKVPLTDTDSSGPLRTKLFTLGADTLAAILPGYISNKRKGKPQSPHLPLSPSSPLPTHPSSPLPYARRLTREDGFIPWELLRHATRGEPVLPATLQQYNKVTIVKQREKQPVTDDPMVSILPTLIFRAFRAFSPWPGIWTEIETGDTKQETGKTKRRLKILSCHPSPHQPISHSPHLILDSVQLEGKSPVSYKQFSEAYLSETPS
ncbi:methionyl-tRNA formyltransferase [Patescibacteria group bacterium]|nr:methionyl-tRNA formyltransferase [Patescibacteria group bacterium]